MEGAAIERKIRGLQPWPVAETRFGKERVRVFRARVTNAPSGAPGTIATDQKTYLRITAGNGTALEILELQAEGRKRVSIGDYLRGLREPLPKKAGNPASE